MSKRSTIEDVLSPRAIAVRRRFEIPVLVAALAVVPVIFVESTSTSSSVLQAAYWANWAIWAAFLVEYIAVVSVTERRWAYTKKAWLDVLVIVVSFPALPAVLASTRLVRLTRLTRVLRLLRLLRLAAVMSRGARAAGAVFRTRGVGYVAVITLLVALGIGGTFSILEGTPILDGLWWSLVTVTTVGYGDMFPITPGGRIAASFLMILGIGLVAYITAAVAAHFVESEDSELAGELRLLHERLDRIEQALSTTEPPGFEPGHETSSTRRSDGHPDCEVLISMIATARALGESFAENCHSPRNPVGEVRIRSPYRHTGSCLLSLKRLSGPPLLLTYFHVFPTTSASTGTLPLSMNCEWSKAGSTESHGTSA